MPFPIDTKEFIRIENIIMDIDHTEQELIDKVIFLLGVNVEEFVIHSEARRGTDSRRKNQFIRFVYSLDVELKNCNEYMKSQLFFSKIIQENVKKYRIRLMKYDKYEVAKIDEVVSDNLSSRPVVVGTGPAGLFAALVLAKAGLKPIVIDRGAAVEQRIQDIEDFEKNGELNVESNIQFGEGGAGTFSDGKLNSLANNDRMRFIFEEFVKAGAPEEILWSSTPHIGTDKLRGIVKVLREQIISLGGQVLFNTCLVDLVLKDEVLHGVVVKKITESDTEIINTKNVVLAIGHSARDTYEMLNDLGVKIKQKTFSVGVRLEHKRNVIDELRFASFAGHSRLGTANYRLVAHPEGHRSVYSFCMCPGGYVVPSASEEGTVVTNGMSEFAQDGENSNSALLVNVFPEDLKSDHPLAGVYFQREIEKKAFELGGGDYAAPCQKLSDFLGTKFDNPDDIVASYKPNVKEVDLSECLPDFVVDSLRAAMPLFERKLKGFTSHEAILTAPETRSSAPVQFVRDEFFQSNVRGLYPTGEGAGYAGGIVSAAIDGMRVAESVINSCVENDL